MYKKEPQHIYASTLATENVIFRTRVNRSITPSEVIGETRWPLYTGSYSIDRMPRGEGEEIEVVFFNVGRKLFPSEVTDEYRIRGLIPADPYSLAAVNRDHPLFAASHPNYTQWRESDEMIYAMVFCVDLQDVNVCRSVIKIEEYFWFAGIRIACDPVS